MSKEPKKIEELDGYNYSDPAKIDIHILTLKVNELIKTINKIKHE